MSDYLDLYDYRIRVAAMYRERNQAILSGADPVAAWERFRAVRDDLFAHHPQSALDDAQRSTFQGLRFRSQSIGSKYTEVVCSFRSEMPPVLWRVMVEGATSLTLLKGAISWRSLVKETGSVSYSISTTPIIHRVPTMTAGFAL
ncbi:MAG: hypothetical protein AUG82_07320 [Ktedonobacter sp. 13_1_20CM_4_53_11]|nr:MAG: hypothetical protein AUG82_07320 [Ktedonobacter sp. 13_1_20CM_4_53_11]